LLAGSTYELHMLTANEIDIIREFEESRI